MDIKVIGGQKISGEIYPSGSKNSAVAIIPATILLNKPVKIENIPDISDVTRLVKIMQKLGSKIIWDKEVSEMTIDNSNLRFEDLDKDDLGNMRGTSLLWGPMLARFKNVVFKDLPGGCTLGIRSLGPHYDVFKKLGVVVEEDNCGAKMDATKARANELWLTEMSVTATENVIMLATLISGTTKVIGAASEPQVQDLCQFLITCGARIKGVGSNILEIEGVDSLFSSDYAIFSDHYEIATYLALGAVTGGNIKVHNALPDLFIPITEVFHKFGVEICYEGNTAVLESPDNLVIKEGLAHPLNIKAQPWPALPVDLLPVFIPLALAARDGQVLFHNWMYEAGLFWTSELSKLGANVVLCDPHRVLVTAGNKLKGAILEAPYIIRAVVSLTMVAMISEGESTILNADALYRGHPNFVENLRKLGASIEKID